MQSGRLERFFRPGTIMAFLVACLVAGTGLLILLRTIQHGLQAGSGQPWHLIDFDEVYVVGLMTLKGAAAQAYDAAQVQAAILAETGRSVFLPWAYPPPYDVFAAGLARLTPAEAYAGFMGLSLLAYLGVIRALAREHFAAAVLVVAPVIPANAMTGQNGLVIGALAGLVAFFWCRRRAAGGGAALGLMVLKPHLALGLGMLALAGRRWRMLALAVGTAAGLALLSTLLLGPGIWPAFLGGARAASRDLAEGRYPLWRIVSLYASLRTVFGLSAGAALAGQIIAAVVALGLSAWAARRLPAAEAAGLALAATLAVSPYAYDYDLALLGPAAALLIPAVRARSGPVAQGLLVAAVWICALPGAWRIAVVTPGSAAVLPAGLHFAAVTGPVLWLALIGLALILRRGRGRVAPGATAGVAAE